MSDFLTRLVQRQEGTVPTVQPRTPSMFASLVGRVGDADFPAMDSLPAADLTTRRSQASLESGNHHGEGQTRPDQQEGSRLLTGSKATTRPAMGLHRSESSPVPLVSNPSAVVPRPVHEAPAALRSGSEVIHEQVPRQHVSLSKPTSEDRGEPVSVPRTARIEAPPPAADTRRHIARSSVTAPPSLASGATVGRRQVQISKTSIEPPVEVTIGRIEVTALSAAPDRKRKPEARRPAMSLEEYLTRRQGGRP